MASMACGDVALWPCGHVVLWPCGCAALWPEVFLPAPDGLWAVGSCCLWHVASGLIVYGLEARKLQSTAHGMATAVPIFAAGLQCCI